MTKRYHFIGIGGVGMSSLAKIMLNKGHKVSGSDMHDGKNTKELQKLGADVCIGHDQHNVNGANVVIYSSAVKQDNPEIAEAKSKKIPILKRADLLAELMHDHVAITVAGAHGKTTTASMISHVLMSADLNPTTAIGGAIQGCSYHANLGEGKYFLAEVDESDGTFLNFSPDYSVITNIDWEHVDHYPTMDHITRAYKQFIQQTKPNGCLCICGDDERLYTLVQGASCECVSYGFSQKNTVRAESIKVNGLSSEFECIINGENKGTVVINNPGRHNVLNALACISLGIKIGIDFDLVRKSLAKYQGVHRRFQIKYDANDILLVDDYGHHPTEVRATLQAAQSLGKKRIVTVFQPHRFSRTQHLMAEFAKSLSTSDYIIITDIYAASEQPIEGISSEKLLKEIQSQTQGKSVYLKKADIVEHLSDVVTSGDLVLVLGAGDISLISEEFKTRLEQEQKIA